MWLVEILYQKYFFVYEAKSDISGYFEKFLAYFQQKVYPVGTKSHFDEEG